MADYFEIDFLEVHTSKSGDAISARYEQAGTTTIHVVDAGYLSTGSLLVEHIRKYYGGPSRIDRVVVTHPDKDHAEGIPEVLEQFNVGEIWMLRPWLYVDELMHRFPRYSSADNLKKKLKEAYPYIATIEELAIRKRIPILEPFQGAFVGAFVVLAPSKARYLDLIVESEKTPSGTTVDAALGTTAGMLTEFAKRAVMLMKAAWGAEVFSSEETSTENEMSVVQYANLFGVKVMLTADAGRAALTEAADYAPYIGLQLPGLDRFQVPHHGGRRNVSTEILDRLLGPKLNAQVAPGSESFVAIISSASDDKDHPRKAVVRAMIHRGAKVITTEDGTKRTGHNAPTREGWVGVTGAPYPEDQEEE
jgi:beta-lactamase superfamily II metal-dependent hydrolase